MAFTPENYSSGNIGWLFSKAYYHEINFDYILPDTQNADGIKKENIKIYESRSKALINKKWDNYKDPAKLLKGNSEKMHNEKDNPFILTVDNPGLVYGTGITHESGNEGEFKIGFLFDHTTGLVVIPGHSIKGMLRHWFKEPTFAEYISNETDLKNIRTLKDNLPLSTVIINKLETEMFEGKEKSIYQRDIFHDAVLINSTHKGGFFLGKDSITPHGDNPLKNPIPLPFIKLLPNTVLQFNFDFKDGIISKDDKLKIMKRLLLDFGIGAKTNVGYGQFKELTR